MQAEAFSRSSQHISLYMTSIAPIPDVNGRKVLTKQAAVSYFVEQKVKSFLVTQGPQAVIASFSTHQLI